MRQKGQGSVHAFTCDMRMDELIKAKIANIPIENFHLFETIVVLLLLADTLDLLGSIRFVVVNKRGDTLGPVEKAEMLILCDFAHMPGNYSCQCVSIVDAIIASLL